MSDAETLARAGCSCDAKIAAVVVVDADGETEEDTLEVILTVPREELLGATLELDDTDVDALVQPEDDTIPD